MITLSDKYFMKKRRKSLSNSAETSMMSASGATTTASTTESYPKKKHSKDIFTNLASDNVEKQSRHKSRSGKNVSKPRESIYKIKGWKSYVNA